MLHTWGPVTIAVDFSRQHNLNYKGGIIRAEDYEYFKDLDPKHAVPLTLDSPYTRLD